MSVHRAVECLSRGDLLCVASAIRDVVESSIRSLESAYANAIDMIVTGTVMIADDIADLGKLDRPHHWIWGVVLVIVGVVVLALVLLLLFLPV
jgi:arginyl-tRNA--protein-N-Asp/Glu arginylyltransferase